MISEDNLLKTLKQKRQRGESLRKIASDYPRIITFGDIQRCLHGKFPKSPKKRLALHLTALSVAPVCPRCGVVHVTKRCTARKRKKPAPVSSSLAELLWLKKNGL